MRRSSPGTPECEREGPAAERAKRCGLKESVEVSCWDQSKAPSQFGVTTRRFPSPERQVSPEHGLPNARMSRAESLRFLKGVLHAGPSRELVIGLGGGKERPTRQGWRQAALLGQGHEWRRCNDHRPRQEETNKAGTRMASHRTPSCPTRRCRPARWRERRPPRTRVRRERMSRSRFVGLPAISCEGSFTYARPLGAGSKTAPRAAADEQSP